MKKLLLVTVVVLTFLGVSAPTNALTLADIELLSALGILTGDQVEIAKQALQASGASGSVGASVRPTEFSDTECVVLATDISRGTSGSAVTALQRFLQKQGHYLETELTGSYDLATFVAVADFQLTQKLITSRATAGAGNVGPRTRAKIQEVSCAKPAPVATEITTTMASSTPTTSPVSFERRARNTSVAQLDTRNSGGSMMTMTPRLLSTEKKTGTYKYRFDMSILPNDYVRNWRVALTCDQGQITTNKTDLGCGQAIRLKTASDGTKSLKIAFTNVTKIAQQIGLVGVALGEDDIELGRSTFVKELEPKETPAIQRTPSGQIIEQGDFQVIEGRLCTPEEQVEYVQYIMTRFDSPEGAELTPPPCYPGEVVCTYDYPISYCEIQGTSINSVSMCGGKQYFYDGMCRLP